MKILHSADWHLDAPLSGRTPEEAAAIRHAEARLPDRVVALARERDCDLILLSGDLFDGACREETLLAVRRALGEAGMPVFIAPGNHDYVSQDSPWTREDWPGNVHIFTGSKPQCVVLPELDCRVYGAAFHGPESDCLLEGFRCEGIQRYCLGVFHGDMLTGGRYNPITTREAAESALDYLALGHIHKQGQLLCGDTLCAWPGCPMGHGFDETGEKGVLLVTLGEGAQAVFLPLDTPRFYDLEVDISQGAENALESVLPRGRTGDFYRVSLVGETAAPDLAALRAAFGEYAHLQLRDRTTPPVDLWANAGEDSLEGAFFALLQEKMAAADSDEQETILLAAKIARKLLSGQEVKLP